MGDYNAEITETNMSSFCEIYHLTNIIKQPTCFKNPSNPSCIDLFLTNNANCFQRSLVLETGLSDFHKLIVTVMKSHIPKQQPKIIKYRNYKGFNETKFRSELTNILDLNIHESRNIEFFKNIFLKVLNKHAPIKTKYLRTNHSPFVTKELSKAIMLRSKLENQYLKCKSEETRACYKIQKNLYVTLLRKDKRDCYENIELGKVSDSKKFWNTVKPVFGNNATTRNNIFLNENEKVVTSEIKRAKIFDKYFVNIVPKLGIEPVVSSRNNDLETGNLSAIIKTYKNHSSIIAIEKYMKGLGEKLFSFSKATIDIVLRNMQKLNTRKASQLNDVPTKYIKKFSDVFTPVITDDYNNCVAIGIFPECFKTAEVIPTYKKDKPTEKTNYRPISILSNISKIYERLMHDNMSDYFNDVLSKFQCDFRRGFGAQNCLLYMIENIRKTRNNRGMFAAVMTDLSEAFDCISHELLIDKLNAYGSDETSLKVIISYLKNCMQTTKVGSSFSELLNIIYFVLQGSILGPLLFIIFYC